jgi:hypothetical protein
VASLLETFYILFESKGVDSVKKGATEAGAATSELESKIKSADVAGAALGDHFLATVKSIALAAGGIFAVVGLADRIKQQEDFNVELLHTSERLNVGVSDLAAYGEAAKREGGSFEGFSAALDDINQNITRIAVTGQSRLKKVFEDLKIQVTASKGHARPLFDVLDDLADRFQKMSAGERGGFGRLLQLDPATVLLLSKGREGLKGVVEQMKALGVPTQEDAEKAEQFELELDNLTQTLNQLFTNIGTYVVPVLTKLAKAFEVSTDYLVRHKTLVEGFFIGVAGIITAVFLPAMIEAAIATLIAIGPFLLIAAAIIAVGAAFALAYDDVMNFLEGNKSVIGELVKRYPAVATAVNLIGDAWRGISNFITTDIKGIGGTIEWLIEKVQKLINFLNTHIPQASKGYKDADKSFQDWEKRTDEAIGKNVNKALSNIGAFLQHASTIDVFGNPIKPGSQGYGYAETMLGAKSAGSAISSADSHPLNSLTSGAILAGAPSNKTNNFTFGNVTVNTQATDANGIAGAFSDQLQTHISHAINQFDDGVQG